MWIVVWLFTLKLEKDMKCGVELRVQSMESEFLKEEDFNQSVEGEVDQAEVKTSVLLE